MGILQQFDLRIDVDFVGYPRPLIYAKMHGKLFEPNREHHDLLRIGI